MGLCPRHSVTEFWFDEKTKESEMTVRCKGKCFHIYLSPGNFRDSPAILEEYLRFAEAIETDGDPDGLQDWALQPFLPLFSDTESALGKSQLFTLHDYLNMEAFHYSLRAANNTLTPFRDFQVTPTPRLDGVDLGDYEFRVRLLSFHPSQVQICAACPENALLTPPEKVLVDGNMICFFKPLGAGEKRSALRELESYRRIEELRVDRRLQVPRLWGLVRDDKNSRCLGLLLSWVECRHMTLESALRSDDSFTLRQKWAGQLTATLNHLHRGGVIWGDAKAANVLIDVNNDLWVIDFGGGYSQGWVEKEKAETIDGDKEGLLKIRNFLFQQS
ncbi:hypothetical protein BDBG_08155 [Blastomyces gilchristii SLH14081]|uniref:Protein kinase domain-containing protein n=1 Tax=Blastomyces gilchristii (strain SLH14081) TaxID=559298 RepID=A0A179UXQ3_BLAGS|nr:uncharacterized protein BDBG_08155 [Blastomyces gilchristii SLH14081]OAT12864.1 hypothetical protein BDBG_08155 [Blastomyces gilchristii SLH14081]